MKVVKVKWNSNSGSGVCVFIGIFVCSGVLLGGLCLVR